MGAGASVEGPSGAEIEKLVYAKFEELDTDKKGFLEIADLTKVVDWALEQFGDRLGEDKPSSHRKIMDRMDIDHHGGKLDLPEFKHLFGEVLNRNIMIGKAKVKFAEFDPNNTGSIGTDRIPEVVAWTAEAYPVDNLENYTKKLIKAIDLNNDGTLNLVEFTNLYEQMLVRLEMTERAKKKFKELDADQSGFLDGNEINALVEWALTYYVEKSEQQRKKYAKALMEKIDYNADGKISLTEFTDIFAEMLERAQLYEEARQKFRLLDQNNSGFLETNELMGVVRVWIQKYCEFEVNLENNSDALYDIFMDKIDVNKDGQISLMEFLETFEDTLTTYKPIHLVKPGANSQNPTMSTDKLNRLELVASALSEFKALDKNNSGFLEKNELIPVVKSWITKYCEFEVSLDTNPEILMDIFMEKIDLNKDGQISRDEFMDTFEHTLNDRK
jgi:Ca2+-binding EF-hand superfamily protein